MAKPPPGCPTRLPPKSRIACAAGSLLATHHDAFNFPLIAKHAKLIVDTRGVYRKPRKNVVKA